MKKLTSIFLAMLLLMLALTPAFAEEPVKISVMTVKTDASSTAMYEYLAGQMKERYNVDVETIAFSGYDQVKLAFEGGEIPTMVYVDDLWQMTLQKYGYFQDITKQVEAYGWVDRSVTGAVEFNNLRTPGQFYSVPFLMAPIVVYYNKDVFEAIGAAVPATYEELVDVMQKCKDAGYIAMEADGTTMYNIMWAMYCMLFTDCGMEDVNKFYYLQDTTDAFKASLTKIAGEVRGWKEKGYLREDVLGIDGSTTIPLFGSGESAMLLTGDWDEAMMETTGLNLGTFNFPTMNAENPLYVVNAVDGAWAVTTSATEAQTDAAMKYIDLCFEQATLEMCVAGGLTPCVEWDASKVEMSSLKREMMDTVAQAGIGFYLDNAAPGFCDVMTKETQQLIGGQVTVDEFVMNVLTQYDALKETQLAAQQ